MTDMINPDQKPINLQREEAIKKLELNYAHGYLEVEEFETRLDLALNTTLPQDLTRITSDLSLIPAVSEDSADGRDMNFL